ncbi:MAG: HAMP domain-containing sensor histidine kinase [Pseudomonadota bacterium]|nr:HAMP domain-containing sensor histidine kinase [Pseudomonadota bacterium]
MRSALERQARWANIAYAVTLVLLTLLGGWWTVLIARLVDENHTLSLALSGPTAEVLAEYGRKRLMLIGESVTLTFLAVILAGLVVRFARRERAQILRLEGVMAASTHELKTPIAGIKALLESLRSGVLPPEKMSPYLDKGLAAAERLEHLVESILAYQSAVARRTRELEARPLAQWVASVVDHHLATPGAAPVDCDLGPAGSVPVRATADPFRVILENLFDNARKYGRSGPSSTGGVRLRARTEGERVGLDVIDEGVGFAPEDAKAIFEPYQRGGGAERRHGTGLGLYIARTLAQSLEGDLHARSEGEGKGATFTLWLRRA